MSINTETGKLLNSSSEEELQVISFSFPGENPMLWDMLIDNAIDNVRLLNVDFWGWVLFENVATVPFAFYFLKKS